jgi:hypothetical protein
VAGVFVMAATPAGVIGMSSGTNGLRAAVCRNVASQLALVVVMVMMGHCYSSGSQERTRALDGAPRL